MSSCELQILYRLTLYQVRWFSFTVRQSDGRCEHYGKRGRSKYHDKWNNPKRHILSSHTMSCHVRSYRQVTLRHVMSCHVMWCHVMSCHVMSCDVMSCPVMWCPVIRARWVCQEAPRPPPPPDTLGCTPPHNDWSTDQQIVIKDKVKVKVNKVKVKVKVKAKVGRLDEHQASGPTKESSRVIKTGVNIRIKIQR